MSTDTTTTLSAPLALPCGVTLQNRLAKAAMSEGLGSSSGTPTASLGRLYARWADSGAALLITGNVMVSPQAVAEPGNVIVDGSEPTDQLRAWAQAATRGGVQTWVQINHPGRQVPRTLNTRPVAPSAVKMSGMAGAFAKPRALGSGDIERIVKQFAGTARAVVGAGFTGVQIHAAHGYLISQFLSPLTNQRTDQWGGTPDKRRRFLLEVVKSVRAEIGPAVPLAVKLNSADFQRGGFTEAESADVVAALTDEGIDLLEISGGTYESAAMMGVDAQPTRASTAAREAYFLEYAEQIRATTSVPLMLTGGFRTASGMAAALESGAIDVVGLGRPMALDPDLPGRLLSGEVAASTAQPRRFGIRSIDGAAETTWYQHQLHRIAAGREPDPSLSPIQALMRYGVSAGCHAARRALRSNGGQAKGLS